MRQGSAASEYSVDVGRALVWAVRVGVMLAALTPFIITGGTLYPYVVGKAIYARVVIELTFALWLLLIFYYPQHRLPRSWILGAFGLWLLASVVAAFAGVSLTRSLWSTYERMQGIVDLAHWFTFTLVAASVFRTFAHWRLLFTLNILACVIVALMGISDYYRVVDFGFVGNDENRLESTLGNPTYTSAYIILNTLISLGLIAQGASDETERNQRRLAAVRLPRRRRRQRERVNRASGSFEWLPLLQVFWLSSIMLNLWALWLTSTRGGLIAVAAAAMVFAISYPIWGHIRVVRAACVAIMGVAAVALALFVALRMGAALPYGIHNDPTIERISDLGLDDPSTVGRVVALNAGYSAFLARPILGWGPENFIVAWGRHVSELSEYEELFDQAHNKVIEELATKGIVGFLTYLLLWCLMARALILLIARRRGYAQVALFVFAMAMLTYFIQNLSLFDTSVILMQFCLLAAFAVAAERRFGERNGHAPVVWLPSRWDGRLGFGRAAALRSSWGVILLPLCVMAFAVGAAMLVNGRAYSAAAAGAQFVGSTGSEWDARAARFNDSVEMFPELGGFPRLFMISEATRIYDSFTDDELQGAAELVESETRAQLELEPQNWRMLLTLAEFYQTASDRDAAYRVMARENLERAREFAPRVVEQSELLEKQLELEYNELLEKQLELEAMWLSGMQGF